MGHREAWNYPTKKMGTGSERARKPWVEFVGKGQDPRKGHQVAGCENLPGVNLGGHGSGQQQNNRERTWTMFEIHQKLVVM